MQVQTILWYIFTYFKLLFHEIKWLTFKVNCIRKILLITIQITSYIVLLKKLSRPLHSTSFSYLFLSFIKDITNHWVHEVQLIENLEWPFLKRLRSLIKCIMPLTHILIVGAEELTGKNSYRISSSMKSS